MLVLSRKLGEKIVLPGLGVTVAVLQVRGGSVMVGIDAPRHVAIRRSELPASELVEGTKNCAITDVSRDDEMQDLAIVLATRPGLTRNEYEAALTRRGFEVHAVGDGLRCLEVLRDFLPDVLVIEPELPWGGGDGVLDIVHEELAFHRVPVFALTAEPSRSAMYQISRFSISDFAIQPLAARQLADRVERLAAQRRKVSA